VQDELRRVEQDGDQDRFALPAGRHGRDGRHDPGSERELTGARQRATREPMGQGGQRHADGHEEGRAR
jgi:hypothetical protein